MAGETKREASASSSEIVDNLIVVLRKLTDERTITLRKIKEGEDNLDDKLNSLNQSISRVVGQSKKLKKEEKILWLERMMYAPSFFKDDFILTLLEEGIRLTTPKDCVIGYINLEGDTESYASALTVHCAYFLGGVNSNSFRYLLQQADIDLNATCDQVIGRENDIFYPYDSYTLEEASLLHFAVARGDFDAVKLLYETGRVSLKSEAILICGKDSFAHNNSEIVRISKVTPLHLAAKNSDARMMRYLISMGVDVAARDSMGATAQDYFNQIKEERAKGKLLKEKLDKEGIDSGYLYNCNFMGGEDDRIADVEMLFGNLSIGTVAPAADGVGAAMPTLDLTLGYANSSVSLVQSDFSSVPSSSPHTSEVGASLRAREENKESFLSKNPFVNSIEHKRALLNISTDSSGIRDLAEEFDEVRLDERPLFSKDFDLHADDSSDEESVGEKLRGYKIGEKWSEYERVHHTNASDNLFSFVAHAASLTLLYSPAVNKHYYHSLKPEYLHDDAISQLKDLIKLAIKKAVQISVESCIKDCFQSTSEDAAGEKLTKIVDLLNSDENFTKRLEEELHKMIIGMRSLFVTGAGDSNSEKILKIIESHFCEPTSSGYSLFVEVSTAFLTAVKTQDFRYRTPKDVGGEEGQKIIDSIHTSIVQIPLRILKSLKVNIDEKSTPGRSNCLKALRNDANRKQYPSLFAEAHKILTASTAKGYPRTKLQEKSRSIVEAFIIDLVALGRSGSDEGWQCANKYVSNLQRAKLKYFLTLTDVQLAIEFRPGLIISLFKQQLRNFMEGFSRKTLDAAMIFKNDDPLAFWAHLRLARRSQQRKIKNFSGSGQITGFLSDKAISCDTRIWEFNGGKFFKASENQRILGGSFARKDEVTTMGSYSQVLGAINEIQSTPPRSFATSFTIDDKIIARSIQEIFRGKFDIETNFPGLLPQAKKTLSTLLASLTYLLLGCEVSRNPGMIIINQMLLDLVREGELTWKEALNNTKLSAKLMPMSPAGAINVSRCLNGHYHTYMPYPYMYDGNTGGKADEKATLKTKEQLVVLEAGIIRKWLKLKHVDVKEDLVDGQLFFRVAGKLHTSTEFVNMLFARIEEHYPEWFGFAMRHAPSETGLAAPLVTDADVSDSKEEVWLISAEEKTILDHKEEKEGKMTESRAGSSSFGPKQPTRAVATASSSNIPKKEDTRKERKNPKKIGLRAISKEISQNVDTRCDSFYNAITSQIEHKGHSFSNDILYKTKREDGLRLYVQGAACKDEKWSDDRKIQALVCKLNCILRIEDFAGEDTPIFYYMSSDGNFTSTHNKSLVPPGRAIFGLIFTGDAYIASPHKRAIRLLRQETSLPGNVSSTPISRTATTSIALPTRGGQATTLAPSPVEIKARPASLTQLTTPTRAGAIISGSNSSPSVSGSSLSLGENLGRSMASVTSSHGSSGARPAATAPAAVGIASEPDLTTLSPDELLNRYAELEERKAILEDFIANGETRYIQELKKIDEQRTATWERMKVLDLATDASIRTGIP